MHTLILFIGIWVSPYLTDGTAAIRQAEEIFAKFMACSDASSTQCSSYTSELIAKVYRIDQLENNDGFLTNSALAKHIENDKGWKLMGPAYRPEVLEKAQQLANTNQAVVAVYTDQSDQLMHVAVILPGALSPSGTWGMPVPNSVSLALYDSDHSFVNKGLSYAFKKHMLLRVRIFSHG